MNKRGEGWNTAAVTTHAVRASRVAIMRRETGRSGANM
jgi:hypothetical protein